MMLAQGSDSDPSGDQARACRSLSFRLRRERALKSILRFLAARLIELRQAAAV
jgi:hypothetical protein